MPVSNGDTFSGTLRLPPRFIHLSAQKISLGHFLLRTWGELPQAHPLDHLQVYLPYPPFDVDIEGDLRVTVSVVDV
jgi:hypothetical protein